MKKKRLLLIIAWYSLSSKNLLSSNKFDSVMQYADQAIDIASDIKTLAIPPINIDDYLNSMEKMKRNEINLHNFLDTYSLKNPKFKSLNFPNKKHQSTGERVAAGILSFGISEGAKAIQDNKIDSNQERRKYFDLYEKIKEIFKEYAIYYGLSKNKNDIWFQIDTVIEGVEKAIDIINEKRVQQSINNAINEIRQQILEIFFDYKQELIFLKEIVSVLQNSENTLQGTITKQIKLFEDIIKSNNFPHSKDNALLEFLLYDSALTSAIQLEYKKKIYEEKRNKILQLERTLGGKLQLITNLLTTQNNILIPRTPLNTSYQIKKAGEKDNQIKKVGQMLSVEIV